jgi:tellurite resistance protein TerC
MNIMLYWTLVEASGGVQVGRWAVLAAVVFVAVAVDVWVLHRRPGRIGLKAAVAESAGWVALALGFGLWVYLTAGRQAGLEFFAGYVIEKSLSLDNILLFLIVFQTFGVAAEYQHRVLYFGIVGALVMRAAFVFAGIALLQRFAFVSIVFGAILLIAGVRMLWPGAQQPEAEERWAVRAARRVFPVADHVEGGARFWIRRDGKWNATPLFLALIVVEVMDVIFAIDSVPAVLAVTRDPFIAYSSNVFAVLGLRAMYFALAALLPRFRFLHAGLAAILIFIGGKMVAGEHLVLSTGMSLGILAVILSVMVVASLLWPKREARNF